MTELADIVVGKATGRPSAEAITQFNALGVGTEDLAAASIVYRKAIERGHGQRARDVGCGATANRDPE